MVTLSTKPKAPKALKLAKAPKAKEPTNLLRLASNSGQRNSDALLHGDHKRRVAADVKELRRREVLWNERKKQHEAAVRQ